MISSTEESDIHPPNEDNLPEWLREIREPKPGNSAYSSSTSGSKPTKTGCYWEKVAKDSGNPFRDLFAFILQIILPSQRLIIRTMLPPQKVKVRLWRVIEPPTIFRFPFSKHKRYEGKISRNRFEIHKIIHHRSMFQPVIIGEICPDLNGTALKVVMRLNFIGRVFLVLCYGVSVSTGLLQCILDWENTTSQVHLILSSLLSSFAMAASVWFVAIIVFKLAVDENKSYLCKLLKPPEA